MAYSGTGNVDAIRSFSGGGNPGTEIYNRALQKSSSTFQRGVIIDVLLDPSLMTNAVREKVLSSLHNPEFLINAPRNSMIVRRITNGKGRSEEKNLLCYPFFSSHFELPAKIGEQLWFVFENPDSEESLAFWLSRIPEPDHVEDVNYTHGDRRHDFISSVSSTTEKAGIDKNSEYEVYPPSFPNGPLDSRDSATLSRQTSDDKIFDELVKKSVNTKIEPVPRFTRRPGDFVLQGSNNTLISLGLERGYTENEQPVVEGNSSASDKIIENIHGTIDIVAGRGRYFGNIENYIEKSPSETKQITTARIVKNSRGQFETDKNPASSKARAKSINLSSEGNRNASPKEGDPDLVSDASRILVSQKTKVDERFGINSEKLSSSFEAKIKNENSAAIVVKSDEIRIIARKKKKDSPTGTDEINGSIRLIKEGEKDKDLGTIFILPDGTIQISGMKIFLGRTQADAGDGKGSGPGNSQPYVKYSELENLLKKTFESIKSFAQSLQQDFLTNTSPGFGAPNPALIKAANAECLKLQTDMSERINEIPNLKSKRIFGE